METASQVLKIDAYHLKKSLDIRHFRSVCTARIILESKSEVCYHVDGEQYIFAFNYGVIVFCNTPYADQANLFNKIFPEIALPDLPKDSFDIQHSPTDDFAVEFNSLSLATVSQEVIKIVMLNVAQSVALMYFDQVSQDLLAEVKAFTTQMEEEGKLKISRKNIMKFIGKALNTKNKIVENLYIFDAPAVTWNNEYLEKVNTTLSRHFELGLRYRSIENNFNIIKDNLEAFTDLYHQSESSKLEWIIIILILVEVLDTFIMKII